MIVGEWDDETVEPVGLQLRSERCQAICISGHGSRLRLWKERNKSPWRRPSGAPTCAALQLIAIDRAGNFNRN
jgi:hypothetical protein